MSSRRKSERLQNKPAAVLNSHGILDSLLSPSDRDSSDDEIISKCSNNNEESLRQPRRSLRVRAPNLRYSEFLSPSPTPTSKTKSVRTLRKGKKNISDEFELTSSETSNEDSENGGTNVGENSPYKTDLFENKTDVAGKDMYGFVTPKKHGSMALLAAKNTPKTPKTPCSRLTALKLDNPKQNDLRTPKTPCSRLQSLKLSTPGKSFKTPEIERTRRVLDELKTPRHVRSKIKKQISKWLQESSDSDFSPDESDYQPSSQEDETDDDENVDDKQNEPKKESDGFDQKVSPLIIRLQSTRVTRNSRRDKNAVDYIPECEGYFTVHANNKAMTSNNTLDRLKNPRLPTARLFALLSSLKLSNSHERAIRSLLDEYKTYFTKWIYLLYEGFNIVLYDLGSKRNLIQAFHQEMLADQHVVVVNGFFPSLTIKDILDGISNEVLDLNSTSGNPHDVIDTIEKKLLDNSDIHIFLIVHNIDGPMLRNSKAQEILSRLAKITNLHLIASIDHINTALLWDQMKLHNFNFTWWDCTTMLPYTDETAYENSLLVQNSGELALSSLRNVFHSLTTNAKEIFTVIVKNQLKHKDNSNYPGMQFKDLYSSCRQAFLVSSDLALRAQLTEFLDHKLVKAKRSIDGSEHLIIPIEANLLEQFINEQE